MQKGKTSVWTAIFGAELDSPDTGWVASVSSDASSPPRRLPLRRNLLTVRKPFVARAALFAALVATGSTPVLAGKGGRGAQQGVPDVNLGLGQLQRATAGVGPIVAPAVSGAAGLTPAQGLSPPGRLDTPGLRLGQGHSAGSQPGLTGSPALLSPRGAVESLNSGNGLAVERSDGQTPTSKASLTMVPETEAAQITSTTGASADEQVSRAEPLPRQLPTCR